MIEVVRSPRSSTPTSSLEQYYAKYGRLSDVRGANGLANLFVGGGHMHARPLVSRQPRTILATPDGFPLVSSFDHDFIEFMRALRKEYGARFIPDVDEQGFSRSGVHADPDSFATLAGYMMNPMSYVAVDNSIYRESLGLRPGYSREEELIMDELLTIVFEEFDPTDINLPKLSTGGMRRFSHDPVWKADIAAMLMDPFNFERILHLVDQQDWITLIHEYELVFAFYMQTRIQADRVGKERVVLDLDYALSGGRRGHATAADKSVKKNRFLDQDCPDMTAGRARNVQAGPWALNCLGQIIATGHMRSLFRRFPKTFHVNTPEEIENFANGKFVVASDITEYDRSMSTHAVNKFFDIMAKFWDPRFAEMGRRLMFAPYYSRPLELEGKRGRWIGDCRDPVLFSVYAGNRSGHWATSLMAKVNKVGDFLIRNHHLGYPVIGHVRSYLEHQQPLKCVNNGDDELTGSEVEEALDRYRSTFEDNGKYGHYKGAPEVGCVLSGNMLLKTDEPLTYKAVARLYPSIEKKIVPERSAGSKHRTFWPIGWLDSINSSSSPHANPKAAEAWQIFADLFRTHLAPRTGDLGVILARASEAMPLNYGALTAIDKEVLEDPEKIHYKYLREQITDKVYEKLASKVPKEIFSHIPKNYYSGKLHEGNHG